MLDQVFRPQATPYRDDQFQVTGSADTSKLFKVEADTQGAGFTLTLDVGAQTASRTLSAPVLTANDTIAALGVSNAFSAAQIIDTGTGALPASLSTPTTLRLGASDSVANRLEGIGWSAQGLALTGRHIGGTRASPAASIASNGFLTFSANGHDGTSYNTTRSAIWGIFADGTHSGTNYGAFYRFSGIPTASTTEAVWLTLKGGASDGGLACLNIGSAVPTTGNGLLQLDSGTTKANGIAFGTDTFLFRSAAAALSLTGSVTASGGVYSTSPALGIGYATGAGSAQTQSTNKATTVTLNAMCGTITMNNAALNATTSVAFTLSNTSIAATDTVIVNIKSGATALSYFVQVEAVAANSCSICLRNYTAGNLSEAVVLSFAVIKAVAA